MEELWQPIKHYSDYYISNCGRVYDTNKKVFTPIKHDFVYVSALCKGKRKHAMLSVKRMLLEYFNIDTYTNKPHKVAFKGPKRAKKKGHPVDSMFYDVMEELEGEYGSICNVPENDQLFQVLRTYFN